MPAIRPIRPEDQAALLALNNAHAIETSVLEAARLQQLCSQAFLAVTTDGVPDAMLIALDQDADYAGVNFHWFHTRLDRFVYVDRVITAPAARGRGLAQALYAALFGRAAACGHDRIVCEVNLDPPNPGSDRLHHRLGFSEIGRARLAGSGKLVRYLCRPLAR